MTQKGNPFVRGLSSLLSGGLILSSLSLSDYARAGAQAPKSLDLVERLALPDDLGTVTDVSPSVSLSPAPPLVVLIQDLHLHYPTQKRIVKILDHLYARNIVTGPVAVEGVQGLYDTSKLASYPSGAIKEKLASSRLK